MTGEQHGYNPYTHGCRCDVCKQAKADYVRRRRAEARANARVWKQAGYRHVAENIKHGTRFGYEEMGCRCAECVEAKRVQWRKESAAAYARLKGGAA